MTLLSNKIDIWLAEPFESQRLSGLLLVKLKLCQLDNDKQISGRNVEEHKHRCILLPKVLYSYARSVNEIALNSQNETYHTIKLMFLQQFRNTLYIQFLVLFHYQGGTIKFSLNDGFIKILMMMILCDVTEVQ